jgi:hypothetical protein
MTSLVVNICCAVTAVVGGLSLFSEGASRKGDKGSSAGVGSAGWEPANAFVGLNIGTPGRTGVAREMESRGWEEAVGAGSADELGWKRGTVLR